MPTEVTAPLCWCIKPPKTDRAKELGNVVWVFETDRLQTQQGAILQPGSYDPQLCSFIWAGVEALDWAPGTYLEIERSEDQVTLTVGTDGIGTTTKNANQSGKITCTLKQGSPTNKQWSALTADPVMPLGLCTGAPNRPHRV